MPHKRFLILLVWGVIVSLFLTPVSVVQAAGSCEPGEVCTFPLPYDPNYRFNMLRVLEINGNEWQIEPGETVSFNDHFGDFEGKDGYLVASGIVGGGLCDIGSMINYVLRLNGVDTNPTSPSHTIEKQFYPVAGVPDEYTVVIYDYAGPGPSGQDILVTNNSDEVVTLKWSTDGSVIEMWVERGDSSEYPSRTQDTQVVSTLDSGFTIDDHFIVEGGLAIEITPDNQNKLGDFLIPLFPFRKLMVLLFVALVIVFLVGIFYSGEFRKSTIPFVFFVVIGIFLLNKFDKIRLETLIDLAPPRDTGFVVDTTHTDEGFAVSQRSNEASTTTEGNETETYKIEDLNPGTCANSSYPDDVRRWCDLIEQCAAATDFDPLLNAAMILQESGGNPLAFSRSGASGLMQVMPRDGISANFMCVNGPCFADRPTIVELQDPETNIRTGTRILRDYVNYCGGDLRCGLMHYGPDPDDLERLYGSRYYYADLILSIYENHK